MEGTYYFISKTGETIYVARELVVELAPLLIAPEIAAGTTLYTWASRMALSGAANIFSQSISGQKFNSVELGGAIISGVVTPSLKTSNDMIRFGSIWE